MEEGETKESGNKDVGRVKLHLENNSDDSSDGNDSEEEDFESLAFPAISPVSNVSTSSGFISCGSSLSSSSKPTTPVPSSSHTLSSDNDEFNAIGDNSKNNSSVSFDGRDTSDNESGGELAINKRRDESDNKHNGYNNSNWLTSSSSSKGIKARSKHRNLSLSDQSNSSTTTTMRYRKKNISLDDEIVIYESDSSLVDSRRRFSNRSNHQSFIMFNRLSSENQGRTSAATISRHKSEENPSTLQPSNQIVSILKRKDSACTGGNQSPSLVTFAKNVKDIEASPTTRSAHRRGILKKRSSLDESSRRYRSHSPSSASSESDKGCMRRYNRRRNSCEEIHNAQCGILKQKSYESTGYSSSSGVNTPNSTSSGVQGILKKPSLTPSDHTSEHSTKHVSISEAVILAAAELCKDMIIDDSHEPYIKPILKLDSDHNQSHEIRPKPILKKNHSCENEEIRSILKSRKSSRDEDNNS